MLVHKWSGQIKNSPESRKLSPAQGQLIFHRYSSVASYIILALTVCMVKSKPNLLADTRHVSSN